MRVCFSDMLLCRVLPPVFQMLHTAQTAEPAVDHDGHSGAESFTLLHAAKNTGTQTTTLVKLDQILEL